MGFGIDKNKVIFLDIDGVLSTHRTLVLDHEGTFDPIGVRLLKKLLDKNDDWCIVLSSTWRMFSHPYGLFKSHGITSIHRDHSTKIIDHHRGSEIQEWLDRHPEIEDYIILDDDSDMLDTQMDKFVQTPFDDGITFKVYLELERRMKGKEDDAENY